jgi:hypothetical protein
VNSVGEFAHLYRPSAVGRVKVPAAVFVVDSLGHDGPHFQIESGTATLESELLDNLVLAPGKIVDRPRVVKKKITGTFNQPKRNVLLHVKAHNWPGKLVTRPP